MLMPTFFTLLLHSLYLIQVSSEMGFALEDLSLAVLSLVLFCVFAFRAYQLKVLLLSCSLYVLNIHLKSAKGHSICV